ncbi:P-loop ATPase, Sll1717 family [Dactylosporangium salmoneum]|uniref:TIR domain-containing protein n=1 Tax=Dactylosporangium salmoneum TaxID=53361 RepID=A0ABP5U357_9ACTN
MEQLFFGYSMDPPLLSEAMRNTAVELGRNRQVAHAVTWEDLVVDGRLIVNEVEAAIDRCTLGIFELSTLSHNVLFEVGLAIGKRKRVAILLDSQDAQATRNLRDFALLTTTGLTSYRNSSDLVTSILEILKSPTVPLWEDLTGGIELPTPDPSKLFYIPSFKEDEASQKLSRLLHSYGNFDVLTADFDEYGGSPLAWFVEEIYTSSVAIFHLTPERAYLSDTANNRASLLAGIARGIGREVLIIVENSAKTAIDYRDLALKYRYAGELERQAGSWVDNIRRPPQRVRRPRKHLNVELAALRFGNHVAESDQEGLDHYFVETRDYRDVVDAAATVFTGKKGTGKTANMLQAAETLRADARNLVCVVKPASYELEALLEVLRRVESRHLGDYVIEGLWKYLLYTEVSARGIEEAEKRPAGILRGSPIDALRECMEEQHGGADTSFSVRLERLVKSLEGVLTKGVDEHDVESSRQRVNTALYGSTLKGLRSAIGVALADRQRIAVLVDNLDKAWHKGADLELLSRLLLGLLTVIGRIVDEFKKESSRKTPVNVTLTVFLRSDIFAFVRTHAREPDKIATVEIEWRDRDLLARVLEERFLASWQTSTNSNGLWETAFTATVKGLPTRDYMLSRVQPRPRDLVFFANSAVLRASNAKHDHVTESDILLAENAYSTFAFEALLVEGVAAQVDLEPILIEFAGEGSVLTENRLATLLRGIRQKSSEAEIVRVLRRLGFLGIEIGEMSFDFGGSEGEMRRADVLAKKLGKARRKPARYQIHPAYRPYLEISE